jgi:hypothetical protein
MYTALNSNAFTGMCQFRRDIFKKIVQHKGAAALESAGF